MAPDAGTYELDVFGTPANVLRCERVETRGALTATECQRIEALLPRAYAISGYTGSVTITAGVQEDASDPTAAMTTWPGLATPVIAVSSTGLALDDDELGITLAHELVHCRQGFWRVMLTNVMWAILRRPGFPPTEEEAYETVNTWYDAGAKTAGPRA